MTNATNATATATATTNTTNATTTAATATAAATLLLKLLLLLLPLASAGLVDVPDVREACHPSGPASPRPRDDDGLVVAHGAGGSAQAGAQRGPAQRGGRAPPTHRGGEGGRNAALLVLVDRETVDPHVGVGQGRVA